MLNTYTFKTGILLFVSLGLLCMLSCNSLRGRYCYNTQSTSECIDFKKGQNFEYNYWIDTGADRGIGNYEVANDEVALNFKKPSVGSNSHIEVKQLGHHETEDTVGIKNDVVYYDTQNFIKFVCRDNESNESIKIGGIAYYDSNDIYLGRAESFGKDTIKINIKNLDFPLLLKFQFSGYLEHELILYEKAQYVILAGLVSNQGYNITSGQKRYSKFDFLKKESKDYTNQEKKKFVKQK